MGQPAVPPGFGPSPSMGQPAVPPGFGPSPSMGQPVVPPGFGPSLSMGQAAAPLTAPVPVRTERSAPDEPQAYPRAAHAAAVSPAPDVRASPAEIAALLDEPDVVPWDRRPLLIVIATGIALVVIGVISALVTIALVHQRPSASWQDSPPAAIGSYDWSPPA
jgi:hypothetical protein